MQECMASGNNESVDYCKFQYIGWRQSRVFTMWRIANSSYFATLYDMVCEQGNVCCVGIVCDHSSGDIE